MAIACIASLAAHAGEECADAWTDRFRCTTPGVTNNTDIAVVYAAAMFDDGSGEALYVAGRFTHAGCGEALNIAKWDGVRWSPVGGGLTLIDYFGAGVRSLAVFDDGSGPALYAGGQFIAAGGAPIANLARWDGETWTAVGGGIGDPAHALLAHDSELYIGARERVLVWDGDTLTQLGDSLDGAISAMTMHDDGENETLHIAGRQPLLFGGATIAKWTGTEWARAGELVLGEVLSIASFDDGSGPSLFAAGAFYTNTGAPMTTVVRLVDDDWVDAGTITGNGSDMVQVADLGSGPALYADTRATEPDGDPIGLVEWDGTDWVPAPGAQFVSARAIVVAEAGGQRAMYAVGQFELLGFELANNVARWDGQHWAPVRSSMDGPTRSIANAHDSLIIGGDFSNGAGVAARSVARYDGHRLSSLGEGLEGEVLAVVALDHNRESMIYAGGVFTASGDTPLNNIAAWDGKTWTALAGGLDGEVFALAIFDDGAGPTLYAGGDFQNVAGHPAASLARWDGAAWSVPPGAPDDAVFALEVFDDGSGAALYVGGRFSSAGGLSTPALARWSGAGWSSVGASGLSGDSAPIVRALAVFDDRSGPAICAGGRFSEAGGSPAYNVARWDGSSWSALGSGLAAGVSHDVFALSSYNPGTRPMLIAGGQFTFAGGGEASRVAAWDGETWSELAAGVSNQVYALAQFAPDGAAPELFVAGDYTFAAEEPALGLASYTACALAECPGDTNGDRIVDFTDLNAVIATFGQSGEPGALPGDLDADGSVGFADLNAVLVGFGASCL